MVQVPFFPHPMYTPFSVSESDFFPAVPAQERPACTVLIGSLGGDTFTPSAPFLPCRSRKFDARLIVSHARRFPSTRVKHFDGQNVSWPRCPPDCMRRVFFAYSTLISVVVISLDFSTVSVPLCRPVPISPSSRELEGDIFTSDSNT